MKTKHLFVLIHIKIEGEVGSLKLVKPADNCHTFILTVPRRCRLWTLFVICICHFVMSVSCGHVVGKGLTP